MPVAHSPASVREVAVDVDADVECTHCGLVMTSHLGSGGRVRYFHCPGCQRWSTSVYADVFRADTKLRACRPGEAAARQPPPSAVRERLQRWLASLGAEEDCWQVLGCSPRDGEARIRQRYLTLAREAHPDAGGSDEAMQRVNRAYEAALGARAVVRRSALPSGDAARS